MFSRVIYNRPLVPEIYQELARTNRLFKTNRGLDAYEVLARAGSRNLGKMFYDTRYEQSRWSWCNAITHLLSIVTEDTSNFPLISAGFMRCTNNLVQEYGTNIAGMLNATDARIRTAYNHYHYQYLKTSAFNPIMHIVYVNSGMSLLKNIVENPENAERFDRITALEDCFLTYTNNNTSALRGNINCIVLRDLFETNENCQGHTYTVFIDHTDETVFEALILLQCIISGCILNGDNTAQSAIEVATNMLTHNADFTDPENIEIAKLTYKAILSTICKNTLEIAQAHPSKEPIAIAMKEDLFKEKNEPLLNMFYTILFNSATASAKGDFSGRLKEAYNEVFVGQDRETLQRHPERIKNLFDQIQALQTELSAAQHRLNTAELCSDATVQEMFNAIKLFKNITITRQTDKMLCLEIKSPLTFFDSNEAKVILNNSNSDASRIIREASSEQHLDKDIVKSIFHDIFTKRKYIVNTFAEFAMEIVGGINLITLNVINRNVSHKENLIAQPHIMGYNCWSQAYTEFKKAFVNQNFETAFAQLVGATQNLTVADPTVFRHCVNKLINNKTLLTLTDTETNELTSIEEIYNKKLEEVKVLNEKLEEVQTSTEDTEETVLPF